MLHELWLRHADCTMFAQYGAPRGADEREDGTEHDETVRREAASGWTHA